MRILGGVILLVALVAGLTAAQDEGRRRNLKPNGGSAATESVVDSRAGWLARQQRDDGGWAVEGESAVAPTGLALLSFLGAGYTDRGVIEENRYVETVRNGLAFLIGRQDQDGKLGAAGIHEHAIATLALTEAHWMTRNPRYKGPAERAVAWLVAQREPGGAWKDLLTTGWAVMAVKSAKFGGLNVDDAVFSEVRNWIHARTDEQTGGIGGSPRDTAIGMLSRILLGEDPRSQPGAGFCVQHLPDLAAVDRVYWYFATMALFQVGGTHWKQWNEAMKAAIVNQQQPDGSWMTVEPVEVGFGRVGETCLMVMCLQVYYRYDRVFGGKGGAGGAFGGRRGRRNVGAAGVEARVHEARPEMDTEAYDRIDENPFRRVLEHETSTFSIDVDTASYANVRRFVAKEFRLPPQDAVRIEELVNYFPYDYAGPAPEARHPFSAEVEVASCPWNPTHRLARIALQGRKLPPAERRVANLVFLLDVSGSMDHPDKLPLLKQSMALLVQHLGERDRVAIVVYAGAAGLVLPPTPCTNKDRILDALSRLSAGGSTAGGAGIELAYRVAAGSFLEGGINRVVLCTDGDFNVGITDRGALTRWIEEQAKSGIELSVLGFGSGNYKDDRMEELSNRGNGNYAYVDTIGEARKVLVNELSATLATIAKDVKVQVFFNPRQVAGYRLIGYENRLLSKEDFADDTKDAGEIGAGHAVTALYELVPAGKPVPSPRAGDENPFVRHNEPTGDSRALFRLRLRYKPPAGETSILMEQDVVDGGAGFDEASRDFRWAAAVAEFGMLLSGSKHKGSSSWDALLEIAASAKGEDPHGYRQGFVDLARAAMMIARVQKTG